jgi:hypothetical protein
LVFSSARAAICSGFVTSKKRASMPIALNECLTAACMTLTRAVAAVVAVVVAGPASGGARCEIVPPYSSLAAIKLSPACMNVSSACICALWPDATASELGRVAALS